MATAGTNQHPTVEQAEEEALPNEAQDEAPPQAAEFGQLGNNAACPMNEPESFSDLICQDQIRQAERELSSFVSAVTKLYAPQQAMLSAQDWLDESELIYSSPLFTERNWRAVTIAASTRLAQRLNSLGNQ
jgi:hypothetical protein